MILEIILSLYLVKNPYMSHLTQVRTVHSAVTVIEKQTKVKFKIGRIRKIADRFHDTQGIGQRAFRFAKFQTLTLRKKWYDPRGANLVVDGPLLDGLKRYIAGLSNRCKLRGGFSIVQLQGVNVLGEDRELHSLINVIHELSHIIGAKDLPYETATGFMNEAAASLPTLPTNYDSISKRQIKKCLNGNS